MVLLLFGNFSTLPEMTHLYRSVDHRSANADYIRSISKTSTPFIGETTQTVPAEYPYRKDVWPYRYGPATTRRRWAQTTATQPSTCCRDRRTYASSSERGKAPAMEDP